MVQAIWDVLSDMLGDYTDRDSVLELIEHTAHVTRAYCNMVLSTQDIVEMMKSLPPAQAYVFDVPDLAARFQIEDPDDLANWAPLRHLLPGDFGIVVHYSSDTVWIIRNYAALCSVH